MSDAKYAALLDAAVKACNILQDAPELNMEGSTVPQLSLLNGVCCEAYQILLSAIKDANSGGGE